MHAGACVLELAQGVGFVFAGPSCLQVWGFGVTCFSSSTLNHPCMAFSINLLQSLSGQSWSIGQSMALRCLLPRNVLHIIFNAWPHGLRLAPPAAGCMKARFGVCMHLEVPRLKYAAIGFKSFWWYVSSTTPSIHMTRNAYHLKGCSMQL